MRLVAPKEGRSGCFDFDSGVLAHLITLDFYRELPLGSWLFEPKQYFPLPKLIHAELNHVCSNLLVALTVLINLVKGFFDSISVFLEMDEFDLNLPGQVLVELVGVPFKLLQLLDPFLVLLFPIPPIDGLPLSDELLNVVKRNIPQLS